MTTDGTQVLIVDDMESDRRLLVERLETAGYQTTTSSDASHAWERLTTQPDSFDVILLDHIMPGMTGFELLRRIKNDSRVNMLPVILQTAASDREEIVEGIRTGAYYYLVKPYDSEMLLSVVATAAADSARYRELQREVRKGVSGLRLVRHATFEFRTIEQANDLGAILANACPDPQRVVVGLTELLINAVEHGNLCITYEEKTQLHLAGSWQEEVDRRLALPENRGKSVVVRFDRTEDEIRITVRDQGEGFDWTPYLQVDPRRALHTHGRGIAMANLFSFDSLEYRGSGNEVTGRIPLATNP